MNMSPGGKELRGLVEGEGGYPGGKENRKVADVLKERPDLIEFVDEYCEYRESVSHEDTKPAVGHNIAAAIQQANQPKN